MATILDFVHSVFTQVYPKDAYVFKEGDESDGNMYFLFQGQLRVCKSRQDDPEKTIKELFPGEFFGEIALISGRPRAMSVQVVSTSAKVGVLNKSVFEKLERTNPQFLLLLLKNTFEKLNRAEFKLQNLYAEIHRKEEAEKKSTQPAAENKETAEEQTKTAKTNSEQTSIDLEPASIASKKE